MQKQPAYLYQNVQELYTDLDPKWMGYRKVYARTLKLYKGIDNSFTVKLMNGDQKLIDVTGKTLWWQLIDRDTAELKGPEIKRSSRMPLSSGLKPWLELIYKKDKSELSKSAERLRYNILWHRYDKTSDYNLGIDVSNARKPGNDDRAAAIKILNYMREKNYGSFIDLVNAVHQKWDKKHEASN